VTAVLRRNGIAQVALIWWSPRLFCGTPFISSAIGRFVNKGVKSTRDATLVGHSNDFPYQDAALRGFDNEICYIGT